MKPHAVASHPAESRDAHEPLDADLHAQADSLTPRLHAVAERGREAARHLRDHYNHAQHQTQARVREHPLQSVAVAIGLGVLLGAVAARLSAPRRSSE